MSQILIISDPHYMRKEQLLQFFHQFDHIDAIIHCGDIYLGFQPNDFKCDIPFYICRGNNDFGHLDNACLFEIDGLKFYITHGHIQNYAYNPISIKEDLPESVDVICFGHTHVPYLHQDNHITIINPGSLALGRTYPRHNTYVLFDTTSKDVHFYDIKTNEEIKINKE